MTALPDDTTRTDRTEDRVSARAARALREAMDRLLAGRPQRTDGRLIKDNLWKEAQVSRATMNRAHQLLAEWNARVAECGGFTPGEARKNDELTQLRKKLTERTRECTELQHQLDAAATAIAALHHDNTLLRQELDRTGNLLALADAASQVRWEGDMRDLPMVGCLPTPPDVTPYLVVKQDNNGETFVVTTTSMHSLVADENTVVAEITPRRIGASFPTDPDPADEPEF